MNNKIFIVEGKSDEVKLKSIFKNIKIFKTNGFDLNYEKIETIKKLQNMNDIYIFTDPDYIGRKIRNKLNQILNYKCYNIYLKNSIIKKGKNGVAEASIEDIKKAFNNKIKFDKNNINSIEWSDYLKLSLNKKEKRIKLCKKLNIEYANHKKLYKMINYLHLKIIDLKGIING